MSTPISSHFAISSADIFFFPADATLMLAIANSMYAGKLLLPFVLRTGGGVCADTCACRGRGTRACMQSNLPSGGDGTAFVANKVTCLQSTCNFHECQQVPHVLRMIDAAILIAKSESVANYLIW